MPATTPLFLYTYTSVRVNFSIGSVLVLSYEYIQSHVHTIGIHYTMGKNKIILYPERGRKCKYVVRTIASHRSKRYCVTFGFGIILSTRYSSTLLSSQGAVCSIQETLPTTVRRELYVYTSKPGELS